MTVAKIILTIFNLICLYAVIPKGETVKKTAEKTGHTAAFLIAYIVVFVGYGVNIMLIWMQT